MKKVISMAALAFLLFGESECARQGVRLQVVPGSTERIVVVEWQIPVKYVAHFSGTLPVGGPVARNLNGWMRSGEGGQSRSLEIDALSAARLTESLKEGVIMNAEPEGKVYGDKIGVAGSFIEIGGDGVQGEPFDESAHQLRVTCDGLEQLLKCLRPEYCVTIELSDVAGMEANRQPIRLKIQKWKTVFAEYVKGVVGQRARLNGGVDGSGCIVVELAD